MAKVYVRLIRLGLKRLEDVPLSIRHDVEVLLQEAE